MRSTGLARFTKSRWAGGRSFNMEELLAPVPAAADYSVSTELWQRLEEEIGIVSARIKNGDDLMPDDVANVRKLKSQVDSYVTDFNKAMRNDMAKYKAMVEKMLAELGYDYIEQFIAEKKQEQTRLQNARIAAKMEGLKTISDGLLGRTTRLKDTVMAKELLPAFTARFPNVQSGAKNKDIKDWMPYFSIIQRSITVMDAFFCDPAYADAVLLPLSSGTIRELLAYARDGKEEHLANVKIRFEEDQPMVRMEKLKQGIASKADAISRIRSVLDAMGDVDKLSDAAKKVRTEQAWEEISLIVRLGSSL